MNGEEKRLAFNAGALIVNADDWGMDRDTTDQILKCASCGSVSSASGMVFMEDSERAAAIALERGFDVGLHLNLTTHLSGRNTPRKLIEHQQRLARCLRYHRFSPVLFHPHLTRSFEYVVAAQLDEFSRLYNRRPQRIDGHHHMHLCANLVLQKLLPAGTIMRRNSSFERGEKGICNRMYRRFVDRLVQRRHYLPDFLFLLPPVDRLDRLRRIFSLAREYVVEIETHPANADEHKFLMEGEIFRLAGSVPIAPCFVMPQRRCWNAN